MPMPVVRHKQQAMGKRKASLASLGLPSGKEGKRLGEVAKRT